MDLKVFITSRESVCDECGENLGHHAWTMLVEGKGALCHAETNYDELLTLGYDRSLARDEVRDRIDEVLNCWRGE